MRRLVNGMAGWAAFHQSTGSSKYYDEHLFYQHIAQIAEGRRWRVNQQQALQSSRRGAPSTIDFVFWRENGYADTRESLAFVEVKYLLGTNPSQDLRELRKDIDKLRTTDPTMLVNNQRLLYCGPAAKFLLIFAQENGLDAVENCASRLHGEIAALVGLARTGDAKNIYRSSLGTHLYTSLEWVVMAIAEKRWPS